MNSDNKIPNACDGVKLSIFTVHFHLFSSVKSNTDTKKIEYSQLLLLIGELWVTCILDKKWQI